jgi:hypothetical protein
VQHYILSTIGDALTYYLKVKKHFQGQIHGLNQLIFFDKFSPFYEELFGKKKTLLQIPFS